MSGRKLVIQIPCLNEEATLPVAFAALPTQVAGYDTIETLVIDDGSTDRTADVARGLGATRVLQLPHQGLARTFAAGLRESLAMGAHTIVNFDADNQYSADDIATITAPVLAGRAAVVVGERPWRSNPEFSPAKRRLQQMGNAYLRWHTRTPVTDAASGFRAFHHDIARRIEIRSGFTYTIEMLLDLSGRGVPITFVPIRVTGPALRPSRLIRSNAQYVTNAVGQILLTFVRRGTVRTRDRARQAMMFPTDSASSEI